jgi:hypothetical protein
VSKIYCFEGDCNSRQALANIYCLEIDEGKEDEEVKGRQRTEERERAEAVKKGGRIGTDRGRDRGRED